VAPKLSAQGLQDTSLRYMSQAIKNGKPLAKRHWMLQRAPESTPFYISDNPVAMVNYFEPQIKRMVEHPGTEV